MKKFLLTLILGLLISEPISAQSFSSALGGGSYTEKKAIIKNGQLVRTGGNTAKKPIARNKTTIKYEETQINPTEEQMEKLMPLIKRIQSKKTKDLEIVCIAKDRNIVNHRNTSLARIFQSYAPYLKPNFREIYGPAVIKSNNNTVEFIEYQ